jgi:hypothetical protein
MLFGVQLEADAFFVVFWRQTFEPKLKKIEGRLQRLWIRNIDILITDC